MMLNLKALYPQVASFDEAAELAQLKDLRQRLLDGNMIVDSVEYVH